MARPVVVVVGSSGSGKTTAVNSVRGAEYSDRVIVPRRYITRQQRSNDDTVENTHITHAAFDRLVLAGQIHPYWDRDLAGAQPENYGFETVTGDSRLRVLSANNAFMRSDSSSVLAELDNCQVIALHASRKVRKARLRHRSPDIQPAELQKRLTDDAADILALPSVIVIDTSELDVKQTQAAFRAAIETFLK